MHSRPPATRTGSWCGGASCCGDERFDESSLSAALLKMTSFFSELENGVDVRMNVAIFLAAGSLLAAVLASRRGGFSFRLGCVIKTVGAVSAGWVYVVAYALVSVVVKLRRPRPPIPIGA